MMRIVEGCTGPSKLRVAVVFAYGSAVLCQIGKSNLNFNQKMNRTSPVIFRVHFGSKHYCHHPNSSCSFEGRLILPRYCTPKLKVFDRLLFREISIKKHKKYLIGNFSLCFANKIVKSI